MEGMRWYRLGSCLTTMRTVATASSVQSRNPAIVHQGSELLPCGSHNLPMLPE